MLNSDMDWLKRLRSRIALERWPIDRPGLRPRSRGAYLAAAAFVVAATAFRLALASWLPGAQFITFYPAVIAATFVGGGAAGLLAVLLSSVSTSILFMPPISAAQHGSLLLLFFFIAGANVAIVAALRRAIDRAGRANARLRDSESMWRGLMEAAPDAIVVVDRSARIVLVNAQAEQMFGYRRAELMGQPVELLVPRSCSENHARHVAGYMADPRTRPMGAARALRGLRKDGTEFPIEASLGPFQAGSELLVSSAIRDITARHRTEAELAGARRAEQEASRAKSDFLSNMSHELRTPLNAVLGFAQMLELDPDKSLTAKQREYVGHILEAGYHQLALVNEVLDLAGIEAGHLKLTIERIGIRDAVEHATTTMLPLAEKAGIRFATFVPDRIADIRADRVRVHQVLLNLVSNAIKYNRPDGSVLLVVRPMPGGRVRASVVDTGIGIAHDQLKGLFQPFHRLDVEHARVEGFGIGLALSRQLVEAIDGTMGCISEPGEGSTFWFELPASSDALAAPVPGGPGAPDAAHAEGYSLLYVEDNTSNVRLMEDLVATLPRVEMLAAPTPQLGLDLAVAHRPDVIVLDLNLPGMNGLAMLARLKAMPETRAIPVLALTAAALPQEIERGRAAGFFRYITKPFDVKAFLDAVDDAIAAGGRPARIEPPSAG